MQMQVLTQERERERERLSQEVTDLTCDTKELKKETGTEGPVNRFGRLDGMFASGEEIQLARVTKVFLLLVLLLLQKAEQCTVYCVTVPFSFSP